MPPVCSHRDVAALQLRHRRVPAIGTADTGADAESALDEVQPVAALAADAVVFHPADVRLVDAALVNQVLHEPANRVVGQRRHQRGVETEAALQAARDVVFAAAFPHAELARRVDAPFAGIEPQHDVAERDEIPTAFCLLRYV